jgi:hypothetical protein
MQPGALPCLALPCQAPCLALLLVSAGLGLLSSDPQDLWFAWCMPCFQCMLMHRGRHSQHICSQGKCRRGLAYFRELQQPGAGLC